MHKDSLLTPKLSQSYCPHLPPKRTNPAPGLHILDYVGDFRQLIPSNPIQPMPRVYDCTGSFLFA